MSHLFYPGLFSRSFFVKTYNRISRTLVQISKITDAVYSFVFKTKKITMKIKKR